MAIEFEKKDIAYEGFGLFNDSYKILETNLIAEQPYSFTVTCDKNITIDSSTSELTFFIYFGHTAGEGTVPLAKYQDVPMITLTKIS